MIFVINNCVLCSFSLLFFVVVVVSFSNGSFPAIPQLQTIIQVADTVSVEMSEVVSTPYQWHS